MGVVSCKILYYMQVLVVFINCNSNHAMFIHTYRVEQKFRYGRNKSWNFLANSIVSDSLSEVAIKTGFFL